MTSEKHTPTPENIRKFLEFAVDLTFDSRRIINTRGNTHITVNFKRDNSLVSELDLEIETLFRKKISQAFPSHGIIGEEFPSYQLESEYIWILDPIDGTQEFINHLPFFGTLIALLYKGNPIVGVIDHAALDICCYGGRSLGTYIGDTKIKLKEAQPDTQAVVLPARADFERNTTEDMLFQQLTSHYENYRVFRSCYGHTTTLLSSTRLTLEHKVHIWDIAASQILVEETGGKFTILSKSTNGEDTVYTVVFGPKPEVKKATEILQPLFDSYYTISN